jgi:hypothetical protein
MTYLASRRSNNPTLRLDCGCAAGIGQLRGRTQFDHRQYIQDDWMREGLL